jgi:hypothetical protein
MPKSTEHGPAGGNLNDVKTVRTIAVGTDPVAFDVCAPGLFLNQPSPASLGLAAEMGLGRIDDAAFSPVEIVTSQQDRSPTRHYFASAAETIWSSCQNSQPAQQPLL